MPLMNIIDIVRYAFAQLAACVTVLPVPVQLWILEVADLDAFLKMGKMYWSHTAITLLPLTLTGI